MCLFLSRHLYGTHFNICIQKKKLSIDQFFLFKKLKNYINKNWIKKKMREILFFSKMLSCTRKYKYYDDIK